MKDYEWQWFHEPKDSKYPRMGAIGSEPIGDGEARFAVFGGRDSLNYGLVDATTGDPFFPGPYIASGPFKDERQVESVARAIMSAWRAAQAGGIETERQRAKELRALAQRVVDAQYPGDTEQPSVAVAVSQLSGWLNDNPEAK